MDQEIYLAAKAKSVFEDLEAVEERVGDEPDRYISGLSSPLELPGSHDIARGAVLDTGPYSERARLIEAGRTGLGKVRRADGAPPGLTEEETIGIEAIIQLEGRPALLVQNGSFESPPLEWAILENHRAVIETMFSRVGRVEVVGHPRMEWVGTGFLVAPDVVMTNRHVAVQFSKRESGVGWVFKSGMRARIDFLEEMGSTTSLEFSCTEVIGIHSRVDLALLRVEHQGTGGAGLPAPLTIRYRSPRSFRGRKIYVIGYPAWDGRRNEPLPMSRIFADVYNVKRLQPGKIRNFLVPGKEFSHDASTLGGNSGSCVIDLDGGKVLGLHFSGRYRRSNKAVALWKLRRSKLFRDAGLNFG